MLNKLISEFYDRFAIYSRKVSRRLPPNLEGDKQELAADIVQNAFLHALERDGLQKPDSLRAWMEVIIRNTLLDELRRHPVVLENLDELADDGFVHKFHKSSEERLMKKDLASSLISRAKLSALDREVLRLWMNGFTDEEVADLTGMKKGTAHTKLHRSLGKIRKIAKHAPGAA